MRLSENFTLAELTRSQTASRRGIDNTPTPEVIEHLEALAQHVLQPLRDHFQEPVTISSGYRSPKLNRKIGGARRSQHVLGQAADLSVSNVSIREACIWIQNNTPYDQLIDEFNSWVHVSYGPRHRRQSLTARRINRRTVFREVRF